MSEYFSDKEDQSFDMPNDDTSPPETNYQSDQNISGQSPQTDESGFGTTVPEGASQQQDITYMAVMAVIIAGMLYILYTIFFTSSSTQPQKIEPVKVEQAQQQPEPTAPVATPQQASPEQAPAAPPTPEPPAPVQSQDTPEPAAVKPDVISDSATADNKKMIMINAGKIDEVIEESQYMTNMVRKLNDAKGNIDNRFEDLESEVDRLVSTLKDLQAKLQMVEKEMVKKKPVQKQKAKEATYSIQAVVEGRAWIEDSKGRNMTVKVGDIIPDYGVVTKVDAVNSLVFTSSGKTIRVSN